MWLLSVGEEGEGNDGGGGGVLRDGSESSAEEQRMTAVGLLLERGDLGAARALVPAGRPVPLSVAMAESAAAVAAGRTTVAAAVPASVASALSRTGARPAPPATDWRSAAPVEVLEAVVAAAEEGAGKAFCERCLVDHLVAQVRFVGLRYSLPIDAQWDGLRSYTVLVNYGPHVPCLRARDPAKNATGQVGFRARLSNSSLPFSFICHVLVSFHVPRCLCLTRTIITFALCWLVCLRLCAHCGRADSHFSSPLAHALSLSL